jgi:hypothetical protein
MGGGLRSEVFADRSICLSLLLPCFLSQSHSQTSVTHFIVSFRLAHITPHFFIFGKNCGVELS